MYIYINLYYIRIYVFTAYLDHRIMLTWKALHTNFRNAFTVTSSEGSRRCGLGTSWANAFAHCCDHELGLLFGFPRCQSCLSLLFCWCQVLFFEGRHVSFGMCVTFVFFFAVAEVMRDL